MVLRPEIRFRKGNREKKLLSVLVQAEENIDSYPGMPEMFSKIVDLIVCNQFLSNP